MRARHLTYYILVWALYLLVLFVTSSCKTKTLVSDHYITENNVSKSSDKELQERFISAFEQMSRKISESRETSTSVSAHVRDSVHTVIGMDGKPIKTERWHSKNTTMDNKETLRLTDSISKLASMTDKLMAIRQKSDSLISAKNDSINVLNTRISKYQGIRNALGNVFLAAVMSCILLLILYLYGHSSKSKQ